MTQRSKSQLDALFADNTSGLITPERLRDFVDSCVPSLGSLHFDDPGTPTTIETAGTYVKLSNTTTTQMLNRFTNGGSTNRLLYSGSTSVMAVCIASLSFTCNANNQLLSFAFARNGEIVTPSIMSNKIASGSDMKVVTLIHDTLLDPGDYLEVWGTNMTSTAAITAVHGYVTITGFLA